MLPLWSIVWQARQPARPMTSSPRLKAAFWAGLSGRGGLIATTLGDLRSDFVGDGPAPAHAATPVDASTSENTAARTRITA